MSPTAWAIVVLAGLYMAFVALVWAICVHGARSDAHTKLWRRES